MTAANYLAKNQWAATLRGLKRRLDGCTFFTPAEKGEVGKGGRSRMDEKNLQNR
jgi:hypothetical protein